MPSERVVSVFRPGVRSLARRVLHLQGYTVLEAEDGEEAILLCDSHDGRIDLVLSDVVMPGMSGPKAVERIVEMRPNVRVLYMSGYTDDAIGHHGVLAEDVHFIQKPFTPSALGQKVREALESGDATEQEPGYL